MGTVFTPILSATKDTSRSYNVGIAETYSWVPIEGPALGRPLYARASYITNFSDMSVNLSAGNLSIGAVAIKDNDTNLNANVVEISGYGAGLQVLTQDLESDIDDVTIGDKDSNYASVVPHLSSLKVTVTNLNDSSNLDAFGRLRVSQPTTLFDSKSLYDKGRFFWNFRQKDGQEIFLANDSSRFATITANEGYFIKETYRRFPYQPGKSQLLLFTGVLSAESNIVKRVGMFTSLSGNDYTDNTVGIYFEATNNNYAWVIRNSSNLVPSQSATLTQWNLDKMDGTGPSGITLDFSKSQIFVLDYEWLGVGRVRCGFNINGITHYCHQFLHANNITGTYMTDCNLPIRAELRSTGASSGSMKTICASIMTEGGTDNPSFITRAIALSSAINLQSQDDRKGLLGIRLNPLRTNSANEIVDVDIFPIITQQNVFGPFKWELVMRPTPVSNRSWHDISQNSSFQYAMGADNLTIQGGETVVEGFSSRETTISLNQPIYEKILKLGRNLDGVPDELWIVVTALSPTDLPFLCSITVGESD